MHLSPGHLQLLALLLLMLAIGSCTQLYALACMVRPPSKIKEMRFARIFLHKWRTAHGIHINTAIHYNISNGNWILDKIHGNATMQIVVNGIKHKPFGTFT